MSFKLVLFGWKQRTLGWDCGKGEEAGFFNATATLWEVKASPTIHSVYFGFRYQCNKINRLLITFKMTDGSVLCVMLCMRDVLVHPLEGEFCGII